MKLRTSSILWSNFIKLLALIVALICVITLFIFRYAEETLRSELIRANENEALKTAEEVRDVLTQARRIAAYLSVDRQSLFFFSGASGASFPQVEESILSALKSYPATVPWIHSVYLYSPVNDMMIGNAERYPRALFLDQDWDGGELLSERGNWQLRLRSIENRYPFTLCLTMRAVEAIPGAVVAVNINLRRVYESIHKGDEQTQQAYWLDSSGNIIARADKQALIEPSSTAASLIHFRPNENAVSTLYAGAFTPYAYAQVYLPEYRSYLVSVTSLSDYAERIGALRSLILTAASAVVICGAAIAMYFSLVNYRPIRELVRLFDNPTLWNEGKSGAAEISALADRIVRSMQTSVTLRQALDERATLFHRTQLHALRSQINPHFLSNTLNMISVSAASVLGDDHPAPQMTIWLSRLLRYSFESSDRASMLSEVKHAKMYTSILEKRYGSLFRAEWVFDSGIENALAPRLLFQPLIENAVYHGLALLEKGGLLIVSGHADETGGRLALSVEDNGEGMSESELETVRARLQNSDVLPDEHIGLANLMQRLRLLYLDDFTFTVDSKPGGTRIEIIIPLERNTEANV
jgi:two-component system sensor histidine kinase YesM